MMMRCPFLQVSITIATVLAATPVFAQDAAPQRDDAAVTLYRQVTPDGRVVYSDEAIKGIKLDHTITVEPPIKGNLWTTKASEGPALPPQVERTQVQRVNSIPPVGRIKTLEEANSDVIRAEMLLEDARARQRQAMETPRRPGAGVAPDQVTARNRAAREVAEAEAALQQAIAAREGLRQQR